MKTYDGLTEHEILKRARDYIAQPGNFLQRARHMRGSPALIEDGEEIHGPVCAIGAIEHVMAQHTGNKDWYWNWGHGYPEIGRSVLDECASQHYPNLHYRVDYQFVNVNNNYGQEAIVRVFDCAIEKTKELEPA